MTLHGMVMGGWLPTKDLAPSCFVVPHLSQTPTSSHHPQPPRQDESTRLATDAFLFFAEPNPSSASYSFRGKPMDSCSLLPHFVQARTDRPSKQLAPFRYRYEYKKNKNISRKRRKLTGEERDSLAEPTSLHLRFP